MSYSGLVLYTLKHGDPMFQASAFLARLVLVAQRHGTLRQFRFTDRQHYAVAKCCGTLNSTQLLMLCRRISTALLHKRTTRLPWHLLESLHGAMHDGTLCVACACVKCNTLHECCNAELPRSTEHACCVCSK